MPENDVQDPREPYRVDKAVVTNDQPSPSDMPKTETVVEKTTTVTEKSAE